MDLLILLIMAVTLAIATLALVVPVWGVRRRIRDAKRAELATLELDLRQAHRAARAGAAATQGRLSDLLSYHAYVEGLSEWPFDSTTIARFVLYLLIPLGSWFGGAFVERFVSSVLD